MIQENKKLLLKDICARLPYEVKVRIEGDYFYDEEEPYDTLLKSEVLGHLIAGIYSVKPYLRPMSSMTEEEMDNLNRYVGGNNRFIFKNGFISADENFYQDGCVYTDHEDYADIIDWLNSHHFDFRNLIEKGLALEAPKDMYKFN